MTVVKESSAVLQTIKKNVSDLEKQFQVWCEVPLMDRKSAKTYTIEEFQATMSALVVAKYKDIEELCAIATPNFGIITNIGKAHLEGFKNYEGVLKTKLELYTSINKISGEIIINGDDQTLLDNVPVNIKTFSYSQGQNSDIIGKLINLSPFVEMEWSTENYQSGLISTQMIGKYNFYNFLAAIAFGVRFGVSPEEINEAISKYSPSNNRSQVKETSRNTLILDCYNANPTSMQSALESFAMINHPKKLFIIGDMLELGTESEQEHQNILNLAKKLNLFGYVVGPIFSKIDENDFTYFASTSEAIDFFKKNTMSDSLILLKGSRGIGLENLENLF